MSGGNNPIQTLASATGDMLKDTAYSFKTGDWNNAGRSYMNYVGTLYGAGVAGRSSIGGESTVERSTREQTAKAQEESAIAAQNQKQAELDAVNNRVDKVAVARNRTPGRSATLLTSGYSPSGNTLLTSRGN